MSCSVKTGVSGSRGGGTGIGEEVYNSYISLDSSSVMNVDFPELNSGSEYFILLKRTSASAPSTSTVVYAGALIAPLGYASNSRGSSILLGDSGGAVSYGNCEASYSNTSFGINMRTSSYQFNGLYKVTIIKLN